MGLRIDRLRERINNLPGDRIRQVFKGIINRVANLWTRSLDGAFSKGQSFDRDDPYQQWQLGATEKHCQDCLTLNGRVMRASEWRRVGWVPQSPDLECGGFNCDCRFVTVAGPEENET